MPPFAPLPLLKHQPRRDRRDGISDRSRRWVSLADHLQLTPHLLRFCIAAGLEIGVDEIVHGMQLLVPGSRYSARFCISDRGRFGCAVGADGFVPQPQTGEDVGGHVLRMC